MRFRIGSIPVEVHPSFLLMGVLLGASDINQPIRLLGWVVVVFVSVLIHELGHAFAFIRFGHQPSIQLYAMGGQTKGTRGVETTAGRDLIISLAGPFAGFAVGGLVWLAWRALGPDLGGLAEKLLRDLLWVNVGWGVLNLLPLYPLDGGQALSAGLRAIAPVRGERIALGISILACIGACSAALAFHWLWAAFIAGSSGLLSFQRLRRAIARGDDGGLDRGIGEGFEKLRQGRVAEARSSAEAVLATATNPLVRRDAAQLLAWVHLAEERPLDALRIIEDLPEGQVADPELRGRVLLRIEGREKEAIAPLSAAFAQAPSASLGRDLAIAMIQAEDYSGALALVLGSHGANLDDATHAEIERALFYAGRHQDAMAASMLRFERSKSPNAAYDAACAAARLERYDEAVRWLERAVAAGYKDLAHLAEDEDLAAIRARPEVQALLIPGD